MSGIGNQTENTDLVPGKAGKYSVRLLVLMLTIWPKTPAADKPAI
jgi:hypothetical protein